jgi:hypothetical protein
VNISSGGLEIGGTEVISSSRAISGAGSSLLLSTSSGNLTTPLTLRNNASTVVNTAVELFLSTVGDNNRGVFLRALKTGTDNTNAFVIGTNDGGNAPVERFRIAGNGNITMTGTLGLTGTRVSHGFFTDITSTNAVVTPSDSTLKQNITPIANATEKVLGLNPVEYTWKTDSTSKVHYGLIAQEVQDVLPEIVRVDGEHLALVYAEIIPYLLATIKELEARITELEGN